MIQTDHLTKEKKFKQMEEELKEAGINEECSSEKVKLKKFIFKRENFTWRVGGISKALLKKYRNKNGNISSYEDCLFISGQFGLNEIIEILKLKN